MGASSSYAPTTNLNDSFRGRAPTPSGGQQGGGQGGGQGGNGQQGGGNNSSGQGGSGSVAASALYGPVMTHRIGFRV